MSTPGLLAASLIVAVSSPLSEPGLSAADRPPEFPHEAHGAATTAVLQTEMTPPESSLLSKSSDPSPFPILNSHRVSQSYSMALSSPQSGPQLYQQRLAAMQAGLTYTRLPGDGFLDRWIDATEIPTYEDWKALLAEEAQGMAAIQGEQPLSLIIGDSIGLWMPSAQLPGDRLWLNQGISGDTTGGILSRLGALSPIHPNRIYLMAGINDIKTGIGDEEILANYRQILRQLRQDHAQAETIVQSLLPTRRENLPNDRIRHLNQQLAILAQQEGATFVNLHLYFTDARGQMHPSLTTDGLHLNDRGYEVWQWTIHQIESGIAMN